MAAIDNDTLMVCLQSVYESVKRYESLLESDTLKDPENISELLISYDEALRVLKSVYKEALDNGADLPSIDTIIFADREK